MSLLLQFLGIFYNYLNQSLTQLIYNYYKINRKILYLGDTMRAIFIAILLLLPCTTICGALPSIYQSIDEYQALLENPQLGSLMGNNETIESILRTPQGFLVKGKHLQLEVEIVYVEEEGTGPQEFDLKFKEPVSLK